MLKVLYNRYQYFFNLLVVLILVQIFRVLDWLAWSPQTSAKRNDILLNQLFEFITLVPIILLLIFSYRWALKRKLTSLFCLLLVFYIVFGPGILLILSTWLEIALLKRDVLPITIDLITKYTPMGCLVFLLFSATFYITHLKIQSDRQRETAYKAETLAKDVQLKMLRYQINPHFLFNVLNSIYTLIDENTEKAKKLVIDMSEYYRYTLNKQQQTITIEKEVESIMKYLEIQKTRFEEEFQYEISIEEAAKFIFIPSFLIHLLIENAVKYGTRTEKKKLIICLSVRLFNDKLFIKVSNTGKLLSATPSSENNNNGTGNGIENLKNRLALYYNDKYSFSLQEEEGWVVADIGIDKIDAG